MGSSGILGDKTAFLAFFSTAIGSGWDLAQRITVVSILLKRGSPNQAVECDGLQRDYKREVRWQARIPTGIGTLGSLGIVRVCETIL